MWPTTRPLDDEGLRSLYAMPVGEPRLRTNFVSTLDGSAQGPDGRTGSINTSTDRQVFGLMRALADLVLVGAGTARVEGYQAVQLNQAQRAARAAVGLTGIPMLAVVSRSLKLDPAITAARDCGQVMVITGAAGDAGPLADAGVEVLRCPGPGGVHLRRALGRLTERGLTRTLCEGGPTLHRQLLADGLVDDVCLTFVPTMVAGLGRRVTDGPLLQADFDLAHLIVDQDGTVLGRWSRRSDPKA